MNKYKLINKQTGKEHLCERVVLDGWDYYVSDEKGQVGDIVVEKYVDGTIGLEQIDTLNDIDLLLQKKVIATNNPNIDIPKVVDEVEMWIDETTSILKDEHTIKTSKMCLKAGYNKSQQTHPNSDEDMIEFGNWLSKEYNISNGIGWWHSHESIEDISTKELLQLWKEQKPKTLYYE
jgi:hypothetical protein